MDQSRKESATPGQAGDSAPDARPRRRGCGWRLLRGCGWALGVIVVLLAALYLGEVYRCSRFTPTGDELFDKYARAVIRRQAWRLFSDPYGRSEVTSLDADTLHGWESEFADDPRFWLLCYSCAADCDPAQGTEYVQQGLSDRYYYLDQAMQRGCADVNVLCLALQEQSELWMSRAKHDYVANEQPVFFWQKLSPFERHAKMQALFNDDILPWLGTMIEAAPDESYPYYRRARHHLINGDLELALGDFEAGNQAPVNRLPSSFPASFIRENTAADAGKRASCVFSAIAHFNCQHDNLPHFAVYKAIVKESLKQSELTDDPRWRVALRDFAVRFGQLRPDEELFPVVGSIMLLEQSKHFLVAQGDQLNVDQRDDLLRLNARIRTTVTRFLERTPKEADALAHYMANPQGLSTLVFSPILGFFTAKYYQHWWDYRYVGVMKANSDYALFLADVSAFDYETFSWPTEEED